jgi:hypothetical protein
VCSGPRLPGDRRLAGDRLLLASLVDHTKRLGARTVCRSGQGLMSVPALVGRLRNCGSSSTPPSAIDSRTGIWSPVRPVRDCRPESRLDHDVATGMTMPRTSKTSVDCSVDGRSPARSRIGETPIFIARSWCCLDPAMCASVDRPARTTCVGLTAVWCPIRRTRSQHRDGATTCGTGRAPTG